VPTYVALLRAVNVGGRAQLDMAQLRQAVAGLGHEDVVTYIQSGNLVLRSASRSAAKVAVGIEERIEEVFGMTVAVVVRTSAELADVAAGNPFLASGADPKTLHVGFLAGRPTAAEIARLDPQHASPDEFVVHDREIYLSCPNGLGRSKLTTDYFERRLGTALTVRGWGTVTKLVELSGRGRRP
jgi:uncharacterized protein (DUF1697 family)